MDYAGATLRTVARWLPAALWAGVIFAGSSVPGSRVPGGFGVYGHLGEYAILAALVVSAQRSVDRRRVIVVALMACALYAVSDEFHQAFVPMRVPDVIDWLADVTGAAFGSAVIAGLRHAHRSARRAPGQ